MPTPAPTRFLRQPARLEGAATRPLHQADVAQAYAPGAADLRAWGLALIVMIYVLYLPVGPPLIYNELVAGPNHLSDTLAKIWSGGRYLAALVVAPVLLVARSGARPFARCWPLLPFAFFAAASIAWSSFPKESMRQSLNLFAVVALTSTLVSWYGLAGFGRRVQIVTGLIMIASIVTALLIPSLGVHHASDLWEPVHHGKWRGILLHKNLLGGIAVISIIFGLRSIRTETRPWRAFFSVARLCSLVCLIMSGSAGAWGGGLIAVIFFMLMKNRVTGNPLFTGALLLVGSAAVYALSLDATHIAEALGRDATFSGRTAIWALGQSMIESHLLFGSGLATDAATFGELAKRTLSTSAMDLHSGYLDLLFNLGVIGAALMVLAVGGAMLRGYAYAQTHSGEERDQAVIFMTLVVAAWAMAAIETSPVATMGDGLLGLWTALPALYQLGAPARGQRLRAVRPTGQRFAARSRRRL